MPPQDLVVGGEDLGQHLLSRDVEPATVGP